MKSAQMSRRGFLAVSGAVCAFPTIIPASALGQPGRPAPSGRVNLGLIGCADGTRVHASSEFGEKQRRFLRYFGEHDRELYLCGGKLETKPFDLIREKPREGEVKLYVSSNHERNFIEGILTGKPVISPCETGHRTITIAHLVNIGLRLGKKNLKWNPETERFVNDPAADALLGVAYRAPWTLAG